eukprot:scaffold3535_cov148-Skeletonema_menzelii.AAC.4
MMTFAMLGFVLSVREGRWVLFHASLLVACLCLSASVTAAFLAPSLSSIYKKSSSLHALSSSSANEGFVQVSRPDGSEHKLSYRVVRPMNLSSKQAAPIVALHGGPSVPSNYLYPLEDAVQYRSIVFYDQLGCGKSDQPTDITQYSIEDSVEDLKVLLKKLGVRKFHLYGQSYGGILAFEYMKSVTTSSSNDDAECLSAILSSAPTNVAQIEGEFVRLLDELKKTHSKDDGEELTDEELEELFRTNHQCRMPEMPPQLKEAYANAGTVWRGTDAIKDYGATPPEEGASRMPSSLIMRGEYDFVSEECIEPWKSNMIKLLRRTKESQTATHSESIMLAKKLLQHEHADWQTGDRRSAISNIIVTLLG